VGVAGALRKFRKFHLLTPVAPDGFGVHEPVAVPGGLTVPQFDAVDHAFTEEPVH
jgi:hypothetical protein